MTQQPAFDFSKIIPGFDFLQNLTGQKNAASPPLNHWVAPTLDPKELERRIQELRTVQFWLEQNATALAATIQALEVQRMTLSTLQSMNVSMSQVGDALKMQSPASAPAGPESGKTGQAKSAKAASQTKTAAPGSNTAGQAAAPQVDPLAWWGALTQQFQHIADAAKADLQEKAKARPQPAATPKRSKKQR